MNYKEYYRKRGRLPRAFNIQLSWCIDVWLKPENYDNEEAFFRAFYHVENNSDKYIVARYY